MAAQRQERLLGTVTGGGNAIGSQGYPRQDGDERDFVKQLLIRQITGSSNKNFFQPLP